jgi:alpha-galactosidase
MKPFVLCLLSLPLFAQIRFLPAKKLWVLDTDRTSYVLGINEENSLQNLYWGKKLLRDDDLAPAHTAPEHASFDSRETMTNEEYPGWGGLRYNEPCVKVTLADGTRDLVLTYVSHEIRGDTLEIHTKDIRYALAVDLLYRVYPRFGDRREALRHPQPDRPARGRRERAVGRMVRARRRRLSAQLSDRALGRRNAAPPRARRARQEGARKPPRQHQPSG